MRWKERIYVKQRRMVKALISSVLVVLLCCTGAFAASSGTTDITVRVKYGQTEARSMLQLVNAFRTGKDAWYWNEDDKTKTTCKDLSALAYDYELEQMAMLRAAEIALSFSHTRPNGDDLVVRRRGLLDEWGEHCCRISRVSRGVSRLAGDE